MDDSGTRDKILRALRTARRAGARRFVAQNTDVHVLTLMAERGLTQRFLGHTVLSQTGVILLQAVAG